MINRPRILTLIFSLLVAFTEASCATAEIGTQPDLPITLQTADKVNVGSALLNDLKKFGSPYQTLKDPVNNALVVVFCDKTPCNHETLICQINSQSGLVQSVAWIPRPNEPEANLDGLFKHYSGVAFAKQRLRLDYGHYFQVSERYSNQERGITISFDPEKKTVTQIYRGLPGSTPSLVASSKKFPIVTVLQDRDTASNSR